MNKLLVQIADTPWLKVFMFGLLLCAGYFFGLRDDGKKLVDTLESEKQSLTEATKQLQVTKKAMENAERFETEITAAKAQFEKVTEFMPPKLSVADLTTLISEKSLRSSVRLLSTAPKGNDSMQASAAKSPFFDSIRVAFKIEGSFPQILGFLSQISRDPRMVMFENSDLSLAPGAMAENPTLAYSGELVGYRYREEKKPVTAPSPGPAGAPGGTSATP